MDNQSLAIRDHPSRHNALPLPEFIDSATLPPGLLRPLPKRFSQLEYSFINYISDLKLNMSKKEMWALWDQAWDIGLTAGQRLAILKNATAPGFIYTNMDASVSGDLKHMVQLIGEVLQQQNNKLTVKHITWYEQHHQSALQWDMVDIDSEKPALGGWSYAHYGEDGKLLSVSDFW